jgi:Uri superfamily endonuclease
MIEVVQPITLKVGRLNRNTFPSGIYAYTGSALGRSNNLHMRVGRHLRAKKKKWWHIDYLLSSKFVRVTVIVYYLTSLKRECHIAQKIEQSLGTVPILKGFGSSDCKHGCAAHLHYFSSSTLVKATAMVETIYHQVFSDYATILYRTSENYADPKTWKGYERV